MKIDTSLISQHVFPVNLFRFYSDRFCLGVNGRIYLPKRLVESLKSGSPEVRYVALYIHEFTHIERQRASNFLIWIMKYLFIAEFRYAEELIAYQKQIRYLLKNGEFVDFDRFAKILSSATYLWCCSYNKAFEDLRAL